LDFDKKNVAPNSLLIFLLKKMFNALKFSFHFKGRPNQVGRKRENVKMLKKKPQKDEANPVSIKINDVLEESVCLNKVSCFFD
jgi:hypothetical protein